MEALTTYEVSRPLTLAQVKDQVHLLQEILKGVMTEGQHYGKIPGAGDKPTLLKPGAEKIMSTFQLWPDPEVEDLSFNDIIRYRVKVKLINKVSGITEGAGVGECSTEEEKYKWRAVVSEDEWNATDESHKRIKYGKKWENGKQVGYQAKQIRTNPYDLANTVVKMAKKRALVDAVLTATAASDIFTQDVEDLPPEVLNRGNGKATTQKPPTTEPKRKSEQKEPTPEGEPSVKDKLHEELSLYCQFESGEVDMDLYKSVCTEVSTFQGKNKEGKPETRSFDDPFASYVSDKWAGAALGKLREKVSGNTAK
jgi:hypothetical protein